MLNKPIKPQTVKDIANTLGTLPDLLLPPVTSISYYNLNPNWILGFVCGEGCFTYFKRTRINKTGVTKLDYTLVFEVSQLPLDNKLLIAILNSIGPGFIYSNRGKRSRIRITNIDILQHFVLPYFYHNPIPNSRYKGMQYNLWLKAVEILMVNKIYSKDREQLLTQLLEKLSAL